MLFSASVYFLKNILLGIIQKLLAKESPNLNSHLTSTFDQLCELWLYLGASLSKNKDNIAIIRNVLKFKGDNACKALSRVPSKF